MVAYTKPQQRKKEESEQLRGERDQIKFGELYLLIHVTINPPPPPNKGITSNPHPLLDSLVF